MIRCLTSIITKTVYFLAFSFLIFELLSSFCINLILIFELIRSCLETCQLELVLLESELEALVFYREYVQEEPTDLLIFLDPGNLTDSDLEKLEKLTNNDLSEIKNLIEKYEKVIEITQFKIVMLKAILSVKTFFIVLFSSWY